MFTTLKRAVLKRIPGTLANLAYKKYLYERELRRAGISRTNAMRMVAARFKD